MSDLINNIFPNQTSIIPYSGLLLERILFDFRRGLPIFLDYQDGYFIKPTEFLPLSIANNSVIISGNPDGTPIIHNDNHNIWLSNASSLLSLIKMSELKPSISVYPCDDILLKQCITQITLRDIETVSDIHYTVEKITQTNLPTVYCENSQLIAYRVIPSFYEYYALIIGNPDISQPVNIRLHAECLTGDLLGSLRCDCQPQLHKALHDFSSDANNNGGIIIYIRQEGRNIGLLNKMRAYELQNAGHDTVDANLLLGFMLDERDYQAAALILRDLGVHNVNILTNNSTKIAALEKYNIHVVSRVAHYTQTQKHNEHYIDTKKNKIGHLPE
jgi:GTP cyclohydrolase II